MDSWVYRPYPPAATPFEGISFLPTVCSILRRARALRQRLKQESLFPGIQPLPGFLPRVRVAAICITLPTPSPPHPSVATLLLSLCVSGTWVSCFLSGTLSYSQWAGIRFFSRKGTGLCGQSQLLRVPTRQTLGLSSPQPGLPSFCPQL